MVRAETTETISQETTEIPPQSPETTSSQPVVNAEAAILIDADTGIVLYEKNADEKLYPASTTKILTSLLVIENCKYDEKIKHSHEAIYGIGPGSSHIGMRENEEITVEQALHGILLASANEVCVAVAEHVGKGNAENFMKMINDRLKKIGAVNTHFANPHGFHDNNHYTTARDMSRIMLEAIQNEKFVKLISTYTYTIPPTNIVSEERILHNSNKFINPYSNLYYKYCIGGKTGFTDEAGNTLVTYFKKDNIHLIVVVMKDQGAQNAYVDSKNLAEYGFKSYEEKELFNVSEYVGTIDSAQYFKDKRIELDKISVVPKENFSSTVPKNFDKNCVSTKVNLPDEIVLENGTNNSLKIGDKVGTIELIYTNGNIKKTLAEIDLVSNSKITAIPEEQLIEEENIEQFWNNTITILIVSGIAVALIVAITSAVIFIKKRNGKKNSLHF